MSSFELPHSLVDPSFSTDPQSFYSVLNLPSAASDTEIRERYRQLSIIFHPDKHHGKDTEETATKRFLEVQKAYEILSDHVTRQAYDLFGLEGVELLQSHEGDRWDRLSPEQIKSELIRSKIEADNFALESLIHSKGRISAGINATSLFDKSRAYAKQPWFTRTCDRVCGMRRESLEVCHTIQTSVFEKTTLVVTGRSSSSELGNATGDVLGAVRHQYSPRLNFEASTSLLRARKLIIKGRYRDGNNIVEIKTHLSPWLVNALSRSSNVTLPEVVPSVALELSRRLFPRGKAMGTLNVSIQSGQPVFILGISSNKSFDYTPEAATRGAAYDRTMRPPTRTGLEVGQRSWSISAIMMGPIPVLLGEYGFVFPELGVELKSSLRLSVRRYGVDFAATWTAKGRNTTDNANSVGAEVGIGSDGVSLSLDVTYLNQRFYLPIILSVTYDLEAALWTMVLPSSVFILAYHFGLKPRRRKARQAFFRKARQELRDAKADVIRQAEETVHLLRDTAKRRMDAEQSIDGLVIIDARYGPAEKADETDGMQIDVTVPLQALVSKSQVYIPGRRSKVSPNFNYRSPLRLFFLPVQFGPRITLSFIQAGMHLFRLDPPGLRTVAWTLPSGSTEPVVQLTHMLRYDWRAFASCAKH